MSNNYYSGASEVIQPLLDGSSSLFNVDGSGTPVNFDYAPGATEIFEVTSMFMVWITSGNVNRPDRFMSISSALTNGVDGLYTQDSVTTNLFNLMTNYDFYRILGADMQKNSLGNRDVMQIKYEFKEPIILDGTKSDYFRVVIQDDLDSLEESGASLIGTLSEA